MTHIEKGVIHVSIDDTPLLNTMYNLNPSATKRAVIVGDLTVFFASIISEYGKGKTAEFIEKALDNAIDMVQTEREENAKSSD